MVEASGLVAEGVLDALFAGSPDALVLCDALLQPVRASAAAQHGTAPLVERRPGPSECAALAWASTRVARLSREAAALALDRAGLASLTCQDGGTRWDVRAAPLDHPTARVCVSARPAETSQREALLRAVHDLNAPLHALSGFGTLLMRESLGPMTAAQRTAAETIACEAARLGMLLRGLVERARTGDHRLRECLRGDPPPPSDLGALIEETVARFGAAASAIGVALEVCAGDRVIAALAAADTRTILENLLTNALAAMEAVGAVGTVRIRVERRDAGTALLRVEDQGPGIPEPMLEAIFEPRVRLAGRGAPDGSGLGLAIARELAARANATLTAANGAAGGAVVTLTVPLAPAGARRVVRLAPVANHAALARAQAVLDTAGEWVHVDWRDGVLTASLETDADPAGRLAASAVTDGFACWSAAR